MVKESEIKRILVALEPSEGGRSALDAAADMAARLRAELIGVYVEDIDLLHMAGLPFSREYAVSAIKGRAVDPRAMARALRAHAAELREAMEAAARGRGLRWSFRVARGRVAVELLAASEDADLVILGKTARAPSRRVRVGSTARTVIARGKRTVVVLHQGAAVGLPVLVWLEDSPAAIRALATAARLAAADDKNLVVVLAAGDEAASVKLREAAAEVLAGHGFAARFVTPAEVSLRGLFEIVRTERCRTLVLAADSSLLREDGVTAVLERTVCPLVIVR